MIVLLNFFSSSKIYLLVLNNSSHVFGTSLLYFDKSIVFENKVPISICIGYVKIYINK